MSLFIEAILKLQIHYTNTVNTRCKNYKNDSNLSSPLQETAS